MEERVPRNGDDGASVPHVVKAILVAFPVALDDQGTPPVLTTIILIGVFAIAAVSYMVCCNLNKVCFFWSQILPIELSLSDSEGHSY